MRSNYCAVIPADIKAEYGEVIGQRIMSYYPDRIPTLDEVRFIGDALKRGVRGAKLQAYTKFVDQATLEAEIDKRNAEVLEEKIIDENRGELYQLKNGKVLLYRPSQIAKETIRGKRSRKSLQGLEASPNNQTLATIGTELHELNENFYVYFAQQSPLLRVKSGITAPKITRPDYLSPEAYEEIKSSIKILVDKAIAKQQTINDRTGKDGQAIVYPEVFIHNDKDIGGTIDGLVVYSNSRIDFLDYKFMKQQKEIITTETGITEFVPSTEISDIKRRTYRLQTGQYRDMLIDSYGVQKEQFDEISIIPFMMDIPIDPVYNEDGTLVSSRKPGEYKNPKFQKKVNAVVGISSEQVKQLPTGYQLTDNEILDDIIVELDKKLNIAIENARKSYYSDSDLKYAQYQDEISKLERLIEHIQREKDANSVLDYVLNMTDYINKNSNAITPNDLTYYLSEIEYFKNLLETVTKITNKEEDEAVANEQLPEDSHFRKALKTNAFKTGLSLQLLNQAEEILRGKLELNLEKLNPDIAEVTSYNFGEKFIPWSEIEEPVIQTAYTLFNEAETKKYNAIKELQEEIKKEIDALKAAGYTMEQANKMIFNDKTGNVISRYDSEKRNLIFQARENNDVAYIKSIYELTDEGKNRYLLDLETRKNRLAAIHGEFSAAYNKAVSKFIDENDLANSENAWLIRAAVNKYAKLKSEEENYSEEYKKLPPAVKKYVDFYYATMQKFNAALPNEYIRENFVPNLRAQSAGILRQLLGVRAPKDLFNLIKRNTVDGLRLRQSEITSLTMDINSPDLRVPLAYKDNFEYYDKETHEYRASYTREENNFAKSKDLMYNLIMFGEAVYHKSYMDETLDTMQALMQYAKYKKSYKQDIIGGIKGLNRGYRTPELEQSDRISKNLTQLIRTHVLREHITSKDKIIGKNISTNKMVSALINSARNMALGFNYKAAFAGFMTGQANLLAYSRKNRQITRKGLMSAYKHMRSANARAMNEYFAIEKENHTQRIARESSNNIINRIFNRDTLYVFYRAEEVTSNLVLGAMARNYGVDPLDGKVRRLAEIDGDVKSIHDMWKEATDSGKTIEDLPLTDEQFAQFRTMVRATSRRIKGTNINADQSVYSGNILNKLFGMFRTWLTPMLMNIYGGIRYNKGMDDFEVGSARVALQELKAMYDLGLRKGAAGLMRMAASSIPFLGSRFSKMSGLKYELSEKASLESYERFIALNPIYANKLTLDEWHQLRQDTMNMHHSYVRMLATIPLLLAVLGGDFDDDGERDSKSIGVLNLAHQLVSRFQTEMLFFYDYSAMREITQSPIPILGFLNLYKNVTVNSFDEARDYIFGENKLTKTGKSADKAERWHYLRRFIPFIYQYGNLIETLNLDTEDEEAL